MTYLIPSCDDYVFTVHCTILEACHWSILGKAYQEMIAAAARQGVAPQSVLELISAEEKSGLRGSRLVPIPNKVQRWKCCVKKVFFAGRLARKLSRIFLLQPVLEQYQRCLYCGENMVRVCFSQIRSLYEGQLVRKNQICQMWGKSWLELFCSPGEKVSNLQS